MASAGLGVGMFVGGIAAGALAGILLAPRKGTETRQILAGKAKQAANKAVEATAMARDTARQMVSPKSATGAKPAAN